MTKIEKHNNDKQKSAQYNEEKKRLVNTNPTNNWG